MTGFHSSLWLDQCPSPNTTFSSFVDGQFVQFHIGASVITIPTNFPIFFWKFFFSNASHLSNFLCLFSWKAKRKTATSRRRRYGCYRALGWEWRGNICRLWRELKQSCFVQMEKCHGCVKFLLEEDGHAYAHANMLPYWAKKWGFLASPHFVFCVFSDSLRQSTDAVL